MKLTLPDTLLLNGKLLHASNKKEILEWLHTTEDVLLRQSLHFLLEWFDGDEHISLKTSGSTGTPKMMQVAKHRMVSSAEMTNSFFGLTANSRMLLCLSPEFIAGKMMIVRAMMAGADLITAGLESNPLQSLTEPIDFTALVPLQLDKILEQNREKLDLIKTIIIGGSSIPVLLESQLQVLHTSCWHTYGMTETLSHIALRPLNGENRSDWFTPLPGIQIDQDEKGCLQIEAPYLYDNKLVTNDMVHLAGSRFKVLGRIDDVIVSAGHKLHPGLIEQKIEAFLSLPFFIGAEKHEVAGQSALLVIEGELSVNAIFQLWKMMEAKLPPHEMPRRINFLPCFYFLKSGKIDKRKTLENLIST
jgi:o-succinylbenzoate---CoA ligase